MIVLGLPQAAKADKAEPHVSPAVLAELDTLMGKRISDATPGCAVGIRHSGVEVQVVDFQSPAVMAGDGSVHEGWSVREGAKTRHLTRYRVIPPGRIQTPRDPCGNTGGGWRKSLRRFPDTSRDTCA